MQSLNEKYRGWLRDSNDIEIVSTSLAYSNRWVLIVTYKYKSL